MCRLITKVQYLKYKVLREVARLAWEDRLLENIMDIPEKLIPGNEPTMRCCVYKERAILGERVKLALGGDRSNPNVIQVLEIACDECPVGGFEVTNACRGCLAHRCEDACKFGAITFDHNHVAHIDKSKCKECGACARVCPYTAIVSRKRPCQNACKVKAISMNDEKAATIDNSKCIQCGACVYQCPFGAIMDKSYMVNAIDILKKSERNSRGEAYRVYAVVAPSISSQFSYAKLGQVVTGLKMLGFHDVIEAALGADMVAMAEAKELSEKGVLTSSCCPAFVQYIKSNFPGLVKHISHNMSPMPMIIGEIRRYLRDNNTVRISRSVRDLAYRALQAREEWIREKECEPDLEQLAGVLNEKKEAVLRAMEAIVEPISLYEPVYTEGGDSVYVIDQLRDSSADSSDEAWLENILLRDALETLGERERNIIIQRFYHNKTQMEIADEIGISQAQVSRLEKGALEHLKKRM